MSKRLTIEHFVQWWIEGMSRAPEPSRKNFFKLSFAQQLKGIAKGHRTAFPQNAQESYARMIEVIAETDGNVYRVSDAFGAHLYKTSLDIPTSVLPRPEKRETIYVQFPTGVSYEYGGKTFDNAVIDIGSPEELRSAVAGLSGRSIRIISFDNFTSIGEADRFDVPSLCFFYSDAVKEQSIVELMKNTYATGTPPSIPAHIVEFCLKVLLYIHTGEPDIAPEAKRYPNATSREHMLKQIKSACPFAVTSLGYSFHHRHRHTDATTVTGHFRWQPHGPGLSKVKLIWIDEHTRRFAEGS